MKNKISIIGMLLLSLLGVSYANYSVLDDKGKIISDCSNLEIERDNQDRFSIAVFSGCRSKQVFSYTGDFYIHRKINISDFNANRIKWLFEIFKLIILISFHYRSSFD